MKARVTVTLKTGVLDPQGKAIEGALASLGVNGVASVRQGKLFDIELSAQDPAEAEAALKSACEKLLANTVIENFRIELDGSTGRTAAAPGAVDPDVATDIAARDTDMPKEGHP